MASIGPACSYFFSFGLIVVTARIAAPLTIIVAGIAIALLGNTLAQFGNWFPYAAPGIVILSVIYALILVRRDPGIGASSPGLFE